MLISYIYFKSSQSIYCKIYNVKSINTKNNTTIVGEDINGGSSEVQFSNGSDYVIVQNDTLKVGDIIDISTIEDERSYFVKGKEIWLQEKINKLNNTNTALNDRLKTLETDPPLVEQMKTTSGDMNTALLGIADVYELVLGGTTK